MRLVILLSALAVVSLVALPERPSDAARAGSAVRMDVEQLIQHADLALEGRVISARALLADSGRIDTEYTVHVDRTFWGETTPEFNVRLPGGVLPDGRGMVVPGMSTMVPGEDVILMLSQAASDGLRLPVGLAQGKFQVLTDRHGQRTALRDQSSLTLLGRAAPASKPADGTFVLDYADLLTQIEVAVVRKRAGAEEGR